MSLLALSAAILFSGDAEAARLANIETALNMPASVQPHANLAYSVDVANSGRRDANSVELTIQLPETNTSPTVAVMGVLSNIDSACTQVGTTLECSLGKIRKGRSASVSFTLAVPASSAPLDLLADASTTSQESSSSDNADAGSLNLVYESHPISPPAYPVVFHCTGQGLTSFFECQLYPSSISLHETVLEVGGTISFVGQPSYYGGSWSQPSPEHLSMTYTDSGTPVAQFEGDATTTGCFEGITTFPGSSWVAPYLVCP